MTLIRQSEYARRLNVSRAAVSQWKAAGSLVMCGELVDVEQSDARLMIYRRDGLPAIVADDAAERAARMDMRRAHSARGGVAQLSRIAIAQKLAALDWRRDYDWSATAQAERARLAARCIGFKAIESPLRDDTHFGRFRLFDPAWTVDGQVTEDSIRRGFGFEASAEEVLEACREELAPADADDDSAVMVDMSLLWTLARPYYPGERRRG